MRERVLYENFQTFIYHMTSLIAIPSNSLRELYDGIKILVLSEIGDGLYFMHARVDMIIISFD